MNDDRDWAETFEPLRRAAQEHRADTELIRWRVDTATNRSGAAPVRRLPLAVAAVTVLIILAIGQLVADPFGLRQTRTVGSRPDPTGTAPVATAPDRRPSTEPATPTPTGASGSGVSSTEGGSPRPPAPTTDPAGTTRPGPVTAAPVRYRWTALTGAGRTVILPGDGTLDWVHPGARADLKLQRAKRPAAGQALVIRQPAGVTSVTGPLRVSWTGGAPEQDHTDDARWLSVPAGGAVRVQVPPSPSARTLRLYLGGPGGPFRLGLTGSGVASVTETVAGAPAGTGPSLLTVPVPAGSDLTLTLTAPAGGGRLALGPVLLGR